MRKSLLALTLFGQLSFVSAMNAKMPLSRILFLDKTNWWQIIRLAHRSISTKVIFS